MRPHYHASARNCSLEFLPFFAVLDIIRNSKGVLRMNAKAWLLSPQGLGPDAMLAKVNERLMAGGLSITAEDAQMLHGRRVEALLDVGRVEFGQPAIVTLAEAVATSPRLSQNGVAYDLANLQDAFYAIRSELPLGVSDTQIAEALSNCLEEWGDAALLTSLPTEEVMGFSAEHTQVTRASCSSDCRIVDSEGHEYTFDESEWDYDEYANGWDGERWADDWDD